MKIMTFYIVFYMCIFPIANARVALEVKMDHAPGSSDPFYTSTGVNTFIAMPSPDSAITQVSWIISSDDEELDIIGETGVTPGIDSSLDYRFDIKCETAGVHTFKVKLIVLNGDPEYIGEVIEKSYQIYNISLALENDIWWFNGENPTNYNTNSTLKMNPSVPGIVKWVVKTGEDKAELNNGVFDGSFVYGNDDDDVTVKSKGPSKGAAELEYDVTVALEINDVEVVSYDFAILTPSHLVYIKSEHLDNAVFSYKSRIFYKIEDQFNRVLPHAVPINEQFTGDPVADWAGMDWRRGDSGGALVNPAEWVDSIVGEQLDRNPTPLSPLHGDANTKVYHWPGIWRVGSLTVGDGVAVTSGNWADNSVCIWQKNRGFAEHE